MEAESKAAAGPAGARRWTLWNVPASLEASLRAQSLSIEQWEQPGAGIESAILAYCSAGDREGPGALIRGWRLEGYEGAILIASPFTMLQWLQRSPENHFLLTEGVSHLQMPCLPEDLVAAMGRAPVMTSKTRFEKVLDRKARIAWLLERYKHEIQNRSGASLLLQGALLSGALAEDQVQRAQGLIDAGGGQDDAAARACREYKLLLGRGPGTETKAAGSPEPMRERVSGIVERVLFIDDQHAAGWAEALELLLGVKPESVGPEEVEERLKASAGPKDYLDYDLIILDLYLEEGEAHQAKLPGELSGVRKLALIRDYDPAVPVVVMTASERSAIAEELRRSGVTEFCTKGLARESAALATPYKEFERAISAAAEHCRWRPLWKTVCLLVESNILTATAENLLKQAFRYLDISGTSRREATAGSDAGGDHDKFSLRFETASVLAAGQCLEEFLRGFSEFDDDPELIPKEFHGKHWQFSRKKKPATLGSRVSTIQEYYDEFEVGLTASLTADLRNAAAHPYGSLKIQADHSALVLASLLELLAEMTPAAIRADLRCDIGRLVSRLPRGGGSASVDVDLLSGDVDIAAFELANALCGSCSKPGYCKKRCVFESEGDPTSKIKSPTTLWSLFEAYTHPDTTIDIRYPGTRIALTCLSAAISICALDRPTASMLKIAALALNCFQAWRSSQHAPAASNVLDPLKAGALARGPVDSRRSTFDTQPDSRFRRQSRFLNDGYCLALTPDERKRLQFQARIGSAKQDGLRMKPVGVSGDIPSFLLPLAACHAVAKLPSNEALKNLSLAFELNEKEAVRKQGLLCTVALEHEDPRGNAEKDKRLRCIVTNPANCPAHVHFLANGKPCSWKQCASQTPVGPGPQPPSKTPWKKKKKKKRRWGKPLKPATPSP